MKQRLVTFTEENDAYLRDLAKSEERSYGSHRDVLNRIIDDYRRKHGAKR